MSEPNVEKRIKMDQLVVYSWVENEIEKINRNFKEAKNKV
jgi:hypothetical protein